MFDHSSKFLAFSNNNLTVVGIFNIIIIQYIPETLRRISFSSTLDATIKSYQKLKKNYQLFQMRFVSLWNFGWKPKNQTGKCVLHLLWILWFKLGIPHFTLEHCQMYCLAVWIEANKNMCTGGTPKNLNPGATDRHWSRLTRFWADKQSKRAEKSRFSHLNDQNSAISAQNIINLDSSRPFYYRVPNDTQGNIAFGVFVELLTWTFSSK